MEPAEKPKAEKKRRPSPQAPEPSAGQPDGGSLQAAAQPARPPVKKHPRPVKKFTGNIVLCGFMGCGKSSVGRRVAKLLDRQFATWIATSSKRRV